MSTNQAPAARFMVTVSSETEYVPYQGYAVQKICTGKGGLRLQPGTSTLATWDSGAGAIYAEGEPLYPKNTLAGDRVRQTAREQTLRRL